MTRAAFYISAMTLILAVVMLLGAPVGFEGMSRQVASLLDGWVMGSPASPHCAEFGGMFIMTCALVRADAAIRLAAAEGTAYPGCLKAAAACAEWYRRALALGNGASVEQWNACGDGLIDRLNLLQDREFAYLQSLQ